MSGLPIFTRRRDAVVVSMCSCPLDVLGVDAQDGDGSDCLNLYTGPRSPRENWRTSFAGSATREKELLPQTSQLYPFVRLRHGTPSCSRWRCYRTRQVWGVDSLPIATLCICIGWSSALRPEAAVIGAMYSLGWLRCRRPNGPFLLLVLIAYTLAERRFARRSRSWAQVVQFHLFCSGRSCCS
jgi:hypothetical protein